MDIGSSALTELRLAARSAQIDLGNFHLLHYRSVDGFLITAKNSGTHWLRWMLSHALAHQFGLSPPSHSSGPAANEFIGHPRLPPYHPELPRIACSHNIPSAIFSLRCVQEALHIPPVVILVRDIGQAMLSHYLKRRARYDMSLSEYLTLPAGRRGDMAHLWWYVEFFNRWGDFAASSPDRALVVRYEDLTARTSEWLARIFAHFQLEIDPRSIEAALAVASRDAIRTKLDPADDGVIVPMETLRDGIAFDAEDQAYLQRLLARRLRHDFGYGYCSGSTEYPPEMAFRMLADASSSWAARAAAAAETGYFFWRGLRSGGPRYA